MRVVRVLKIGRIVLWVIIILYLVLCIAGFCLLRLSGLNYYVILSGSMQPEINVDDVVVSRSLNETEVNSAVNVGDVATYFDGSSYVTHRVYDKTIDKDGNTVFIFKGDNNNTIDRYSIKASQIRGKQVYILRDFAWMFDFLNSFYGVAAMISVLLLLFITENTLAYAVSYKKSRLESSGQKTVDDLQPKAEMS